jgi:hypothetical protein
LNNAAVYCLPVSLVLSNYGFHARKSWVFLGINPIINQSLKSTMKNKLHKYVEFDLDAVFETFYEVMLSHVDFPKTGRPRILGSSSLPVLIKFLD